MVTKDFNCERDLIAAAVNNEKVLAKICTEMQADDFTDLKSYFNCINEMYQDGKKVDTVSLYTTYKELLSKNDMGLNYAETVMLKQLDIKGVNATIERLKDLSKKRKIVNTMVDVKAALTDGKKADEIFGILEESVIQNTSYGMERVHITPKELADCCLEAMARRLDEDKLKKTIINTSFGNLNKITGGFEKGDLIIISGDTGGGKSAFCMNIAKSVGIIQKRPVAYINSEMSTDQIALRFDSMLSGVSHEKLRAGEINAEEQKRIMLTLDSIYNSQLHLLTIPDLTITNILSEIRRCKRVNNVDLVIVDYIGRMDMSTNAKQDDWKLLKAAAQKMKTLAQELQIVVIMVSQLNGSGELAQGSYMKHEADLWLNLTPIDKSDLVEFQPWNISATIKKARNADKRKALMFRFEGDILTFIDDKGDAEKCYEAEQAKKGMEAFGETTDTYKPSSDKGRKYSKSTKKDWCQ